MSVSVLAVEAAWRVEGAWRVEDAWRAEAAWRTLGLSWLAIGIVYLLVLTRGLTREPPEMTSFAEAE